MDEGTLQAWSSIDALYGQTLRTPVRFDSARSPYYQRRILLCRWHCLNYKIDTTYARLWGPLKPAERHRQWNSALKGSVYNRTDGSM